MKLPTYWQKMGDTFEMEILEAKVCQLLQYPVDVRKAW